MKRKGVILVLDNIRSRENVGSIFRTADGVGASKIYLCGITPNPETKKTKLDLYYDRKINTISTTSECRQYSDTDKIAKTALGAEKWVPWEYYSQTWRLLKLLRDDGLLLLALEKTKNSKNIFELSTIVHKPLAVIVGNEVKGLHPNILKYCDEVVHIPMHGKKESLNVAVAAGIALYQLIKQ